MCERSLTFCIKEQVKRELKKNKNRQQSTPNSEGMRNDDKIQF